MLLDQGHGQLLCHQQGDAAPQGQPCHTGGQVCKGQGGAQGGPGYTGQETAPARRGQGYVRRGHEEETTTHR